jgi:hypothetical protein
VGAKLAQKTQIARYIERQNWVRLGSFLHFQNLRIIAVTICHLISYVKFRHFENWVRFAYFIHFD